MIPKVIKMSLERSDHDYNNKGSQQHEPKILADVVVRRVGRSELVGIDPRRFPCSVGGQDHCQPEKYNVIDEQKIL